ncbi:MAG: hypothetical protein HIU88_13505, partial [Acidobacteria bacterium]|nr:hypothetical protein [Acidobacteriota bacterium]
MTDDPLATRRVAGYRVLRSLARDRSSEVLLGFHESPADSMQTGVPGTVALKVTTANPTHWREYVNTVEALDRARGDHVMAVIDGDGDGGSLCLVLERLPRGTLSELLLFREHLDAGEVVTILAPLVGALREMHGAGVAHGALTARSVMFREDGAPVLIGFGRASLFAAGSPEIVLEREQGVSADRRGIVELASLLLTRVDGARRRAAHGLRAEVESCDEASALPLLAARLFGLAAAVPVRFVAEEQVPAALTRAIPVGTPVRDAATVRESVVHRTVATLVPASLLRRGRDAIEESALVPVLAAGTRRWRTWSRRRRRMVMAGTAGFVTVAVALAMFPSDTRSGAPESAPTAALRTTVAGNSPSASSTAGEWSTADADAISGDDPLVAAAALARGRDRCLLSMSLLCLEQIDQVDSGSLRDDRAAVHQAKRTGEPPPRLLDAGGVLAPELVERLGDSAIVRLTLRSTGDTS